MMASSLSAGAAASNRPSFSGSAEAIAASIDHTLLKPEATETQIRALSQQALENRFASVCVNPSNVRYAVEVLRGSETLVCTVVGFPLGATLTSVKCFEAAQAARIGARELDMVMNVGALKSSNRGLVQNDIRAVANVAHQSGCLLKVILETGLLTLEEKIVACELSLAGGANYVKTCSGFAPGAATVDDIALMRGVVGSRAGVKASGGIKTAQQVISLLEAGATRIGTSNALAIMLEITSSSSGAR